MSKGYEYSDQEYAAGGSGSVVDAIYHKAKAPMDVGNPYIEDLPYPLTDIGEWLNNYLDSIIGGTDEANGGAAVALAFTADGNPYKFYTGSEEYDDYTGFFEIAAEENTVTLTLPDGASMESALRYKYGTEDIEITNADETDHFEIVFSSENGQVIFTFSLPSLYFGITLDPPSIVF